MLRLYRLKDSNQFSAQVILAPDPLQLTFITSAPQDELDELGGKPEP